MAEVYYLTEEDRDFLNLLRQRFGNFLQGDPASSPFGALTGAMRLYVCWIGGTAITARSGTTPGSGNVDIYKDDADTLTAVSGFDTEPVKSIYRVASNTNVYCYCARDSFGTLWYIAEDCP